MLTSRFLRPAATTRRLAATTAHRRTVVTLGTTSSSLSPGSFFAVGSGSNDNNSNSSNNKLAPCFHQLSSTRRHFATSSSSDTVEELSAILAREIEEETSSGDANIMPEELVELKSKLESDWRIVDESLAAGGAGAGGGATIKMFKKSSGFGGAKIGIIFHCQDTLDDDDDGGIAEEGGHENEEGEEAAVAVRFTVTVSRAGKTMVLTCISEEAMATVERVAFVEGDAESVADGIDEKLYQGPEFTELAEDLQDAFNAYVRAECGVDEDVAAFIAMYADYREQAEYVDWLTGVQGMLQ